MKGKGRQFVPHGRVVQMGFPGGAGYGDPSRRQRADILRDLAHGFISPEAAAQDYNLDPDTIADTLARAKRGDTF